jgi:hypothetical protein
LTRRRHGLRHGTDDRRLGRLCLGWFRCVTRRRTRHTLQHRLHALEIGQGHFPRSGLVRCFSDRWHGCR